MNPFFQQSARRIVSRTSGRKQSSSWAWKTTQFGLLTGTAVVGTAFAREFYSDYQEQQQEQYAAASMNDSSTTNITPPPINQYSLPRSYDRQSVRNYWIRRPVSVVSRLANITYELCPSLVSYGYYTLWLAKQQQISIEELEESKTQQAIQLREALTNLGPAFVKAGQQLAIRPDLVPPVVLKELQKLCDSVRPIPDVIALQLLQEELFGTDTSTCTNNSVVSDDTTAVNNNNTMMTTTTKTNATKTLDDIFEDLHLVASASLGQVYKAKLKESGEYVAIKVRDV